MLKLSNYVYLMKRIALVITILPLLVVLFISQLYQVYVTSNVQEHVLIFRNGLLYYAIFCLFFVVALSFSKYLYNIKPKHLFLLMLLIFLLCSLYLAFNADTRIRADQYICFNTAKDFNNGNFKSFIPGKYPKGYTNYYPFQLGWITVLRIMLLYTHNVTFFYCLNILLTIIGILLLVRISEYISHSYYVQNMTIILSFLFIPNLFNVLFVYGNLIGFILFLVGVLFFIKNMESFSYWNMLILFLACAFSYLIKSNYQITIIAFVIVSIIMSFSNKRRVLGLLLLLAVPLVNFSLSSFYTKETHFNIDIGKGIPKNSYVVMGLNADNPPNYGWINYYTLNNYTKNHYNYKLAKKTASKDLKQRLRYLEEHKGYTFNFFKTKLISTWSDSLFESIWNGPHNGFESQVVHGRLMSRIYSNNCMNLTNRSLSKFSKLIVGFILLGCIVETVKVYQSPNNELVYAYLLLALTFFTGGFLFHLIWETKSQYVWQYILFLVPISAIGCESMFKYFRKLYSKIIGNLKNTPLK